MLISSYFGFMSVLVDRLLEYRIFNENRNPFGFYALCLSALVHTVNTIPTIHLNQIQLPSYVIHFTVMY